MPARRRPAKRTDEYGERETRWNEQHDQQRSLLRARFGKDISNFDAYGTPLGRGDVTSEDVAWADVVKGLGRAVRATGDPLFVDAIACLRDYQLDKGCPKRSFSRVHSSVYGDEVLGYLENMRFLLEKQRNRFPSIRAAAEEVASSYYFKARTFAAAVDELRKCYSRWKLDNFPKQKIDFDKGDIGYMVRVKPIGQKRILVSSTHPPSYLPDEGLDVLFTTFWRRRFQDGDVWVGRVQPLGRKWVG